MGATGLSILRYLIVIYENCDAGFFVFPLMEEINLVGI